MRRLDTPLLHTPSKCLSRHECSALRIYPKDNTTMAYKSIDPNTGKLIQSFEEWNSTQLEKSLAAAEQCFHSWKRWRWASALTRRVEK